MLPARNIINKIPEPSFARDFAATKALNNGIGPAISFSRGSNATYFDANGVIQYAPNNALLYSEGGTFSTWNISPTGTNGLARTLATGTINGYNYVDITWSGTANTTGALVQDPNTTTAIIADIGQLWTFSSYVSVTINSGASTATSLQIGERNSSGSILSTTNTNFSSSTLSRVSVTRTLNQSTVARVTGQIRADVVSGTAYNFTIRISQPQLELGVSSPTDYKPTTGTAFYGPRFDTDPVTKQSKGLLIEEARANIVPNSGQMQLWNQTRCTVTSNATTSPDGNNTATQIIETTATGGHYLYQSNSNPTLGGTYCASFFVKPSGRNFAAIGLSQRTTGGTVIVGEQFVNFDLVNKTIQVNGGSGSPPTVVSTSITSINNGWLRISVSVTLAAVGIDTLNTLILTAQSLSVYNGTGDGTSGIYAWGAQLELGSFPTSYIPTGASTATRAADVAQVTNTIAQGISNSQGTYFVKYQICSSSALADTRRWSLFVNETGNSRLSIRTCDPIAYLCPMTVLGDGTANQTLIFSQATGVGPHSISFAWDNSSSHAACDVIYLGNGIGATIPTTNTNLYLGSNSGSIGFICGWISSVGYFSRRFTNQQLIALTR